MVSPVLPWDDAVRQVSTTARTDLRPWDSPSPLPDSPGRARRTSHSPDPSPARRPVPLPVRTRHPRGHRSVHRPGSLRGSLQARPGFLLDHPGCRPDHPDRAIRRPIPRPRARPAPA
ncbi:hypothetical protein GCM10026982_45280 [Nocardiopsis aegyptia]